MTTSFITQELEVASAQRVGAALLEMGARRRGTLGAFAGITSRFSDASEGAGIAANDVKPARAAEARAVDRQPMAVPGVVSDKAAPEGFFDQVLARLRPSKGGKSRIAV
jgi:hypothetical protein